MGYVTASPFSVVVRGWEMEFHFIIVVMKGWICGWLIGLEGIGLEGNRLLDFGFEPRRLGYVRWRTMVGCPIYLLPFFPIFLLLIIT